MDSYRLACTDTGRHWQAGFSSIRTSSTTGMTRFCCGRLGMDLGLSDLSGWVRPSIECHVLVQFHV